KARQKEDYPTALLWYQNAQRMGMDLRGTIALVSSWANASDSERSLAILERAVRLDQGWLTKEDQIQAVYNYALQLFLLKDYDLARKFFWRTIKLSDQNENFRAFVSMSYLYLGVSYAYQGDLEHALPLLEMSIEVGPRNEWAHINYAIYLYYFDPSKVEEVNEHFHIALDLLPNDLRLWQAVIGFWVDKNFEQQREYCKLATQQGIEAQNLCDGVE
ncbi:MAG: hypothetical protein DDG59_02740, partial [Anaerolineae bacterium]